MGFGSLVRADGNFILVSVAIRNGQNTAITMDTNLFEIVDSSGNIYSASEKSMEVEPDSDLFLAKINPGVTKVGRIVFDVPTNLSMDNLRLRFRGGMTGDSAILVLRVNSIVRQAPAPPEATTPLSEPTTPTDKPSPEGSVVSVQPSQNPEIGAPSIPTSTQQPAQQPAARSDGQVERDLIQALDASKALKSSTITGATVQGEVTLSGRASNESSRELAESIASYIPGVTKVHNNLTVGSAPIPISGGDGNVGGLYRIGGRVSAPIALNSVVAAFTDEARQAKRQGVCLASVIVDAQGNPQNPRVVRGLGMGLDEKALEAVRNYKFKPAMLDGRQPVPVLITVEVNFRLY
jgi:TonB family protein